MSRGNSAQDHLTVGTAGDVKDPFLAFEKIERVDGDTLQKPRGYGRITGYILIFSTLWCLAVLVALLFTTIVVAVVESPWEFEYDVDWPFAEWRKPGTGFEGLARQSTSFLRNVIPLPCHSHNDYWRKVPVYSALRAGCTGVEADVWLFNDDPELYIGHDRASLTPRHTFQSLYVNPLVEILKKRNAGTSLRDSESYHGVFETYPEQTLVLLVDIKTDGAKTLDHVESQLEPLRAGNWLSYVENGVVHKRQVTVVGSGHTPFDLLMQNSTYRDIFFDAPLGELYEDPNMSNARDDSDEILTYNTTNSFYASVNFKQAIGFVWSRLSENQLRLIRGQIRGAHKRGLKVRYWNTPSWPLSLRDRIWKILVAEGADILNVDSLEAVRKELETYNATS